MTDPRSAAASLARDGYTVLPRLLTPDQLGRLRLAVDRLVAASPDPPCVRPHNTQIPLRWDDPLLAAVLADPDRVRRLRIAAGARDLRWISGYVSVKDPHSPALWWQHSIGARDDERGFREPAELLRQALSRRLPERTALVHIPEMAHALADEPGLEPAPQTAEAGRRSP